MRVTHNLGVADAIITPTVVMPPGSTNRWTTNVVDVTTNAFTIQMFNINGTYNDSDFYFSMELET